MKRLCLMLLCLTPLLLIGCASWGFQSKEHWRHHMKIRAFKNSSEGILGHHSDGWQTGVEYWIDF